MRTLLASAPGKVVISGEYAVLDGAPAIAAAISSRARVLVRPADGPHHVVTSPGSKDEHGEFRSDNGGVEWLSGAAAFRIVEHAWQATGASPAGSLAFELDTREFFDRAGTSKLGLGSSAALMTALTAAMLALDNSQHGQADVAATSFTAHRDFQHGAGSGVDVACSVHGGLIGFRVVDPRPTPLAWPGDLRYALFWSRVPASTTAKLDSLSQQAPKQSRVALDEAAARAADAWSTTSAARVIEEMHAYTGHLHRFSVDHELGIFDAGHAGLMTEPGAPVVYKPCGAGGGDIGIALAVDADALAEFAERAGAAGFVQLDAGIDPQGYQVTREDD